MANNPQFKVIQLAKDLGLKSKDVVDLCADMGMDIKTQKTLEPGEFDLLFDALTKFLALSPCFFIIFLP